MTCHVAISSDDGAVILSDSQWSTNVEEFHGEIKQLVGEDFIVGASGSKIIIDALFDYLAESSTARKLEADIRCFFDERVTAHALANPSLAVSLLLVTEHHEQPSLRVQHHSPNTFVSPSSRRAMGTIGSGAAFVQSALQRDQEMGTGWPSDRLVDCFITAVMYLVSADRSLTVNDKHTCGFMRMGRTYLFGEPSTLPSHVPSTIAENWPDLANRFLVAKAMAETVAGEIKNVYRQSSSVLSSSFVGSTSATIMASQSAITSNKTELETQLIEFFTVYDGLLGR